MSGWAPVRARKVVASMHQERWGCGNPCPETLAEAQLSSLLEVEELQEWSVSKLADQWGWSRRKARRVLVEWVSWLEEQGPANRRQIPAWVRTLIDAEHSERARTAQAKPSESAGATSGESEESRAEAQVGHWARPDDAPRARSSSSDRDAAQPQTETMLVPGPAGQDQPAAGLDAEAAVYAEWETHYRTFRSKHAKRPHPQPYTATPHQLRCVTRALREIDPATGERFTVSALVLLIRYAFEAPAGAPHVDWWRQNRGQYLQIESLMVKDKLAARLEVARDWEAGEVPAPPAKRPGFAGTPPACRGHYRPPPAADVQDLETPYRESAKENLAAFERKRKQLAATSGGG